MRIKHWQGYGTVNARKIRDTGSCLIVEVSGNHEYGLVRQDRYDVFKWLVKRFNKTIADYTQITDLQIEDGYKKIDGLDVEVATYYIYYRKEKI